MYINKRISLRLYLYILFFFDSPATSRARAISSWRWTYYILNGERKTNLRRQRIRAQTYYYYNYHYTRVYNSASVEEARGRDGSGSAPVRRIHATRRVRLIVFFFFSLLFFPNFSRTSTRPITIIRPIPFAALLFIIYSLPGRVRAELPSVLGDVFGTMPRNHCRYFLPVGDILYNVLLLRYTINTYTLWGNSKKR